MEEAVGERSKAFAAAHRSDENRQAYISAFRHALSVIAEAWRETCSSLSPKSNSKSVYSVLSLALLPPFLTSPTVSLPGVGFGLRRLPKIPLFWSPSQTLHSRARGYLSKLHPSTCPVKSHLSFCSHFFHAKFLAAATGPDQVA